MGKTSGKKRIRKARRGRTAPERIASSGGGTSAGAPGRGRTAPERATSPGANAPTVPPLAWAGGVARPGALAALALGLLVIGSYFPAFFAGFVWDDEAFTEAAAVREVSGLWRIWSSPRAIENEGHYWPLVYTTFWLEHKLWGFAPAGYHAVNVALHLANTLLLWRLAGRLAVPGAWLLAAVFAVHPLHVESVAWVIERKDLLSGLFYLAAFLAWVRFTEERGPDKGGGVASAGGAASRGDAAFRERNRPPGRRRFPERRYLLALALFVLAMLSKSIAATLPAALLILHWWKRGRVTGDDLRRLAPFFAVGLAIAIADVSLYSAREPVSLGYSLVERLLIAAHALWFYAGKLLWPAGLAVIYPHWEVSATDPLAWGYVAAAVALAAALWLLRRRIGRGPLAGVLFFAVTLAPVLGFVDYGYMQFSFVADRYQYLAGIGLTAVLAGAAAHGAGRLPEVWRKAAAGAAAAMLLVLGVLTWRQAEIYRDEVTFFTYVVSHNPTARGAQGNLGTALLEAQRPEEALAAILVAVEQDPDDVKVHANAGAALVRMGRLEEAEERLRHALEFDPRHTIALQNLAESLRKQGRFEEALDYYRVAMETDAGNAMPHAGMGDALFRLGRYEESLQSIDRALALEPELEAVRALRESALAALRQEGGG